MQIPESIEIAPDKNGPRDWVFCFNHAAIHTLEKITGQPAWAILVNPSETFTRLVELAWAGTTSFRHNTRQFDLTFEDFRDGCCPFYLTHEWHVFQDRVTNLVSRTFPRASETRTQLQTLQAAQILSNLGNTASLIGTNDSTPPSDSSDSAVTNSGTSGTGSTSTN